MPTMYWDKRTRRILLGLALLPVLLTLNAWLPRSLRPVNNAIHGTFGPEPHFPKAITDEFSQPYRFFLPDFQGGPVMIHYGFKWPGVVSSPFFHEESPYEAAFYGAYAFGPERQVTKELLRDLVLYDLGRLVLSDFHKEPVVNIVNGVISLTAPAPRTRRPRLSYLQYGWPWSSGKETQIQLAYETVLKTSQEGTLVYFVMAKEKGQVKQWMDIIREENP